VIDAPKTVSKHSVCSNNTHRQLLDLSGGRFKEDQMNGGEYGHMTWANEPPSRKARFDDVIDMGDAAESTTIGSVMSTLDGPLCYLYL
jgi:hypothetical protein